MSMIKISGAREMRFTCVWIKANCALDGRLGQREPSRRMVEAQKIKLVMSMRESAIRLEEVRITGNSLVQQIDRLQQICFQAAAETQREKSLGTIIKIESDEIGCWRLFNGKFLCSRNFRAKALSDRSCKLTLDRKQVIQIAIVFLRPDKSPRASVYQSSLEVKTRASTTPGHGALQNVRN